MMTVAATCRATRLHRPASTSFARSGGALVLLLALGCDLTNKNEPRPSEPPAAAASGGSAAKAESAAVALPDKDVKALVDRWLTSQNQGDFEAYQALFAERFEGVKRVGNRRQSFDRKSWLEDRKSMFQKEFTVKLDDMQVAASGASAIVEFDQTWTSATFQDEGPKRLLVVQGKDGLAIAKEEMLESTLAGATAHRFSIEPRHFSFVWDDKIIFEELEDLRGVTGHPEPTQNNVTTRPIDAKLLPGEQRSLLGKEFVLYGEQGKLCSAKVKELEVHVEVQPHFGQEQRWTGFDGATPVTPAGRALEIWALSAMGGRFLAGRLELPEGCGGALWARAAELPAAKTWSSRPPNDAERAKILTEVRKQVGYRTEQTAYSGQTGERGPWEETPGGTSRVVIFEGSGGAMYADVSMFHTGGGCGADYEGIYWAMLRLKGDDWTSVNGAPGDHIDSSWPRVLKGIKSEAAFDLDGDGVPEFVGGYDLIKSVDGKFQAVHNLSPGFYDCGC